MCIRRAAIWEKGFCRTRIVRTIHLSDKEFHVRTWCLLAAFVVSIAACGCTGDSLSRVEIKGVVTAENGPVANASVQFLPIGNTQGDGAIGIADGEGKFDVISSRDRDAGAPPGKYRVRVMQMINPDGTVLPAEAIQADYPMAREGVPAPYSTMESPLEVTIPEGGGLVEVKLPVKTLGK